MRQIVPLATVDPVLVEAVLDRAFGPDRRRRTAYAVRAGTDPIAALSLGALADGALAGLIQCWPVELALDDGGRAAMAMVGPVAVDPPFQQGGIGHALMAAMLEAAAGTGDDAAMMLIGDPGYYGRFFGFDAGRTARWRLPGPVEAHRLLARGPAVPSAAGSLGPRTAPAG